jgi:hypothetical protein
MKLLTFTHWLSFNLQKTFDLIAYFKSYFESYFVFMAQFEIICCCVECEYSVGVTALVVDCRFQSLEFWHLCPKVNNI